MASRRAPFSLHLEPIAGPAHPAGNIVTLLRGLSGLPLDALKAMAPDIVADEPLHFVKQAANGSHSTSHVHCSSLASVIITLGYPSLIQAWLPLLLKDHTCKAEVLKTAAFLGDGPWPSTSPAP
jgi:hypothetical protein